MNPCQRSFQLLAALLLTPLTVVHAEEIVTKPNIVLIVADDLGYGDLSCYGATLIDTPNIDRLASQGKRFTDAHAAATVCSPSRYAILTGRSPWRLGKKGNGYRIEPGRVTMASLLKDEGYRSAAIGKWHLGYSKDWNKPPIKGPLEVGFDYHFGVPQNHNDNTRCFIENHDIVGREPGVPYRIVDDKDFPEGLAEPRIEDQVDSTLTAKAIDFIRRNAERPFFLYFTPTAPHTHITPAAKFRGTSKAGLLGDYVQELDHHVGDILGTLDELKLTDNTLVIFTSDNGGSYKDFKGTSGTKLNLASEEGDILNKYQTAKEDAKKMGHSTNGIWRDGKGHPEEGGHRISFIARWPGKIPAGTTSDYTLNLADLMATSADIVAAELPKDAAEDSISILPRLLEKQDAPAVPRTIYVQGDTQNDAIAICSGRWKMIAGKGSKSVPPVQLYDLHNDPSELKNLAKQNPELVQRMLAGLEKARKDGRTRP
ncbi:sulfatase-like hydrolase/transferase [Haloferula chungangensis]|uniref:Sulfatase-like hydrolase/transferase n=1 Tax=Haloferula chungangensis TaxID=1048331 RepID=A0ABW2L828_9BACT